MAEQELPDFIALLLHKFPDVAFLYYLYIWRNVFYAVMVAFILCIFAFIAARRKALIPEGIQNIAEIFVEGIDDFVCGILGSRGRKHTPFIGTLFIYILSMNMLGLIPFFKSATASLSTTLALALCVFCYVQYSAIKEMGVAGYLDHLAGKPRGAIAFSVVLPAMLFLLHLLSEVVKPLSLSLRLRSNIWGDDLLLSVMAGLGLKGIILLLVNMLSVLLSGIVQSVVFSLLATIYLAAALPLEEE
ncbi:MAG: F0F1 ATP synthase subunit A [Candidatus Omnitrophica bacterium]|nr:F0F1 ATP synthase subunit A [Candidatus Omnitrophota bacterium]